MTENPPQKPPAPPQNPPGQPPTGQYPPGQPPGQPPGGQYPPQQPPTGQYPPQQPPTGQYPPQQPPAGQYPPQQPPAGQYPPQQPPTGQYPPAPCPDPGQGYPQPTPTPTPTPTPPKCPDPCDSPCPWGPPPINPECCPDDGKCCSSDVAAGGSPRQCTWNDVDDPCVRAASAGCGGKSTKLSCKCESSNADCNCDEWDCGYPDGICVPCKPCEGLIPEPPKPGGNGGPPPPADCSSDGLRAQLEANRKLLLSKQSEKAQIDVEIKASQDREKDLAALIKDFDTIITTYKTERHKLVCREDCLKGFYRDISKIFHDPQRFPTGCNDQLQAAINRQLCESERAKCCQKNLEWKLGKDTRLIAKQKEADKALADATDAFANVKDLPKWMGKQFDELEAWKDQIAKAINDKDPQVQRWAFYLFFWKFAPALCKRFKPAICCERPAGADAATPTEHIGCAPGDWHPSKVTEDVLKKLICCAWDYMKKKKVEAQQAAALVDAAKQNLDAIKKKVADDEKTLDDRIKVELAKVVCAAAGGK